MERFRVRILPAAQIDMREIVKYINTPSPVSALNLYDEITEGIGSLAEMPMRCPLLKTPQLRAKGYRALLVKNYVVFFIVQEDVVQIRRVLYAKRQFAQLL